MMLEQNMNEATARALMALLTDVREAAESAERVRIQVEALAARYGISACPP